MKELIYYPSFEVKSSDWLKFALLYIDELRPIIPYEGDNYLSDEFRKISESTDLLKPLRPDTHNAITATLDSIEVVEKIIQSPKLFYGPLKGRDIISEWQDSLTQDYVIFRGKYSYDWKNFCIENNLGHEHDEGISVNRTLGLTYMSLLANIISEAMGISPITDHLGLERISLLARRLPHDKPDSINIAKGIINLQIPAGLSEIDIDTIIAIREKKNFKQRLHAFHHEYEQFMDRLEQGETGEGFLDSLGSITKDFSDEFTKLGFKLTQLGIGLTLLLNNPDLIKCLEKTVAGGYLAVNSIIGIRNTWKNTETRRFARKYIADLRGTKSLSCRMKYCL